MFETNCGCQTPNAEKLRTAQVQRSWEVERGTALPLSHTDQAR